MRRPARPVHPGRAGLRGARDARHRREPPRPVRAERRRRHRAHRHGALRRRAAGSADLSLRHLLLSTDSSTMNSQVVRSAFKQGVNLSAAARPASIFASSVRPYSSSSTPPPSSSPVASTSEPTESTSASAHRPTPTPQPTNLPGSNLPAAHPTRYSPLTVSVVTKLAKLFGYHSQTSTAIRTTSDYYDRCAERGEIEAPFWYEG